MASGENAATPQALLDRWENYHVFYTGLSVQNPSAILFAPKAHDDQVFGMHTKGTDISETRVVADKWIRITERSEAETIVRWLNADVSNPPTLYEMLGPEDQFFGYIYISSVQQVVTRALDAHTLFIEDIPMPFRRGGGP